MTTVDKPAPALAWPPRPPRLVLGRPAGQLVCWQAAALLGWAAVGQPLVPAAAFGVGAALLVAATGWRFQGRWAYEWAWLWLRFRLRQRRRPTDGGTTAELALFAAAGRTRAVTEVEVDGFDTAFVEHAGGLTAVLELDADDPAVLPELPLRLLPPAEDGPAASVQLIVHSRPIPAIATHTRAWFAVCVRPGDGYAPAELRSALVTTVRRLRRRLRDQRVAAQVLDTARLSSALSVLTRLELTTAGAGRPGREDWRTWWTGDIPQETLRIRSWPGLPAPPDAGVFATLLSTPSLPQTMSLAVRRLRTPGTSDTTSAGPAALAVELAVRLAERDRLALDAAVRWLAQRLVRSGVTVERLDGRQVAGLAATLPLGGFPPS